MSSDALDKQALLLVGYCFGVILRRTDARGGRQKAPYNGIGQPPTIPI